MGQSGQVRERQGRVVEVILIRQKQTSDTSAPVVSAPCALQSKVCLWPIATEIDVRCHVGDWGMSGLVVLSLSFVAHDPERTSFE